MNWLLRFIPPLPKWKWPNISLDLNKPADRWKAFGALFIALIALGGIAFGGVKTYEYTESTEFCGTVCHSMYPQYERHQASAHSNVACAHCHVGPGAQAFIQSKIDGTRQLIGEITNNYHRPIPSPVHNLRPARETCEACHSPTTFKDNIIKIVRRYDNDEKNTPVTSTLILKMGGWNPMTGIGKGIHWHISSEIYYIPLDEQRQEIAWIGVKQADGTMKEYFLRDIIGMGQTKFVEEAYANDEVRRMDCIDCHNRAAHYIPYPEQAVDEALNNGQISKQLPFIRKNAVELLKGAYANEQEAYTAIEALTSEYNGEPAEAVSQAVVTLKEIYHITNFPEMKLDWTTNVNNERHTPTLGCFRCHDDRHVLMSETGVEQAVVSSKCNQCHTVPIVGIGDETIIEAPVVIGNVPASHSDFRWTVEHRDITEFEKQECYNCHGQSFCNNGVCHNLSHPPDMLYTHAEEYRKTGEQLCHTCHQSITCVRCHAQGIIKLP